MIRKGDGRREVEINEKRDKRSERKGGEGE